MAVSTEEAALLERIMTFVSVMFPENRGHRPHWRQRSYRDDFFALFVESTRFTRFTGDMLAEHARERFRSRLSEDDVTQLHGMFQAWDEWRYCKEKLVSQ